MLRLGEFWEEKALPMHKVLKRLFADESGQDLIEYALIAALIALVVISGLNGLSSKINSVYTKVGNDL
jgi:pilus assembly protein Flp/PilA